jgi:hypothetical protein
MVNYESIISLLSVMLILVILFIVIFDCRCHHYYERFTNEEEKKGNEKFISEMEDKMKKEKIVEDSNGNLSQYEKTILEGLTRGSITTETFTNLVKNEKFTENNLNNLIAYVEKTKGGLGIEDKKKN